MSSPTLSLLLGETLLSFYPLLIKSIGTTLFNHVLIRLITTCVVCFPFLSSTINWQLLIQPKYVLMGLLYVFHIYVSYYGFTHLTVGVALTLYYIYPLINVLIHDLLDRSFDWSVLIKMSLGLLGIGIISLGNNIVNNVITIGAIIAMLLSAFTESTIYTLFKINRQISHPTDMLFTLSFAGAIVLSFISLWSGLQLNISWTTTLLIALINAIIGVGGHLLQFYSLTRMSTNWYSVLIFVEVIFAYLSGWFFLGESITVWHLMGTLLILLSVSLIRKEEATRIKEIPAKDV